MGTLTLTQAEVIKAILANDESSTDQELIEYFTNEIKVSREIAEAMTSMRTMYLNSLHIQKIYHGKQFTK
jgi:hypothetical protein